MPYRFNDYVSTYVDPQSVTISTHLQDRFLEAFKANDSLSMAVEQMQAALPFEKDMQRKRELQREIENNLALLADRGDYHNLGFQVHSAAKKFSTKYAPIKQNYDAYQGALSSLKERLDKDDINPEQYAFAPGWMVGDYKGFEEDPETGRPKDGTMFSPKTVYKDPKPMDRVTERLQILREKKVGSKITRIGVGPDGKYTETVGNTISEIPQEDVNEVVNSVLQEPDVKAYVSQLADMKAANVISSGTQAEIFSAQRDAIVKNIDQRTQDLANKKYSAGQKKQLGEMKTAMEGELAKLDDARQDPALAQDYLRSKFAQEIVQPIRDFAALKAGVFERTEEYAQDYDKYWMAKETERLKNATGTPFYTNIDITVDKMGGATVKEKQATIADLNTELKELDATIANPSISDAQRDKARSTKFALANTRNQLENQIAEAANKLSITAIRKVDPKLVTAYERAYPETANNPGKLFALITQSETVVDKKVALAFEQLYGPGEYQNHIAKNYMVTSGMESKSSQFLNDRLTSSTPAYLKTLGQRLEIQFNLSGDIDAKFAEMKTSNLYNFGDIEAGDKTQQVSKAADEFFLNKPLPPNLLVIDGEDGEEHFGSDYIGSIVIARGYDSLTDTWSLHITNEGADGIKGDGSWGNYSKTVIVKSGQLSNPQLEAELSRPEVRFGGIVSRFKPQTKGAVNSLDITGTVAGNRTPLKLNIESRGTDSPLVWVTFPDGSPYFDNKEIKRSLEEREMQAILQTLDPALD